MTDEERHEVESWVVRRMDQLRRFWAHAVVQISAWVLAIFLGALFGYIVTIWAEKTRELRYTVSPVRTSIVKVGTASAL